MSDQDCIAVLAHKAIRPGTVVIDAGAGTGAWTSALLAIIPGVEVHCFEPDLGQYRALLKNLSAAIAGGQVIPHHDSVGGSAPGGSGAGWLSLAAYAKHAGLKRLPFVRLGKGVPVTAAIAECGDLLRRGHVEFILAWADAEQEKILCDHLLQHRYEMFRHPAMEGQVLCCSDRFRSTIKNEPRQMPDVLNLCQEFGITPKGVIHVGAHEGHEAKRYVAAAIKKTIMVEANPAVYARLLENVAGLDGVTAVNCAAGDRNGMIELRVTNADQSSSILPLARHSEIYPSVRETAVVEVQAKTIDQILQDGGHQAEAFNLMNLDIQGAELMALKGAEQTLAHVQAILTEVNYEELYTGCALIETLDAFLEERGFDRVATTTPYHCSWGDAFYVRRRQTSQPGKSVSDFLYDARNTLVNGWLNIPVKSLQEAWEGATGHAHRHLVESGVRGLPLRDVEDQRVFELLKGSLRTLAKERRLNLALALMLYVPIEQIASELPSWLRKSVQHAAAA